MTVDRQDEIFGDFFPVDPGVAFFTPCYTGMHRNRTDPDVTVALRTILHYIFNRTVNIVRKKFCENVWSSSSHVSRVSLWYNNSPAVCRRPLLARL